MAVNKKDKKISILLGDLAFLEDYINDIFTFSPLPFCFVSPSGVILESNPVFVKFSNFTFDEIIGKAIEELFNEGEIEKLVKDTLEKGFVEGREMKFFPKGKTEISIQVFTRVREDEGGKVAGYFMSFFDLTKIKKTENELRERIEELEAFHNLTANRELKMIELKNKIIELEEKISKDNL